MIKNSEIHCEDSVKGNHEAVTEKIPQAIFISDLHLGIEETAHHRAFIDYLKKMRSFPNPPSLFILGDLFNYWVGRSSETSEGHRIILEELNRSVESGQQVAVLRGNRDFLLDGRVASRYNLEVVPHHLSLKLGKFHILACHGDLLLIHDLSHLRFRWISRSFWVRVLMDLFPASWAERIAAHVRRITVGITKKKENKVFEVPPESVARLFRGGYDIIICGHVHHPSCRQMVVDDKTCTLYSLGGWEEEASVLEFDGEEFRFVSFPLETA